MSASHPPMFVSVTKLEYRERNVTDDDVACYLFLNSKPISVFKISDPHHFVSISVSSPDDILQFIFQTDEENEAIGCVSFLLKNLLNSSRGQYAQWVTLFDDPEDDIFDGVLGEHDEEWPRSLITFDVQGDKSLNVSKVATPQKERILSNEASPVKDATQETLMDFSGDLMSQRSHYPPVFSEQNNNTSFKIHIVPTGPTTNDGENVDIVPDFPSSENPLPMEKEILYQSGGGTQEVLTQPDSIVKYSTFREKHLVTEAERRKETFGTSFEFGHEDGKVDGVRGLEKKMAEMKVTIDNLEREKTLLKKNEQTYHLKLNHSRIEVEKLKFNKENYESTIQELEEKLTQERSLRILLEKEKESLTERSGEKKKRGERDSPNQLKCYEPLFSHKERKYKEEIENLQKQNAQLKSDWKLAKTQVDCDESIIQNLQKEIHSLRQKNKDATAVVENKDNEYYDKKIQDIMDICSLHLFNNSQDFDSLEEFIEKFQGELQAKNKEMTELQNTNEGLQLKLSVSENKMLADSLWNQINSFKQQISTLEKERDKLKNELSKTNDNYIKLTNKYTELTDVLAELQKPVQRLLKSNTKASVSPTPNRSSGKINPPQTYRFENTDETELKMMEFISQHGLQPAIFQRVEKNVYIYNRRKLFIRLVKGKLVVKIGVGFKPLQEFLRIEEPYERTPPRQKRFNTEFDKSFEGSKHNKSDISNVLATEPSYRDYSPSGSFIRENIRDLSDREYDNDKGRRKSKVREKFQEITSSKSVERRISFNLYQPESSRNYGRLTPI